MDVSFRLGLPFAWSVDGASPNGVRAVEAVTLTFPTIYPLQPPRIELRPDFDRSLAHVQPGPPDTRPQPCIYDGNLGELLQQQGIAGLLNQMVSWLEDAALGLLIDPTHGWEPVRRDSLDDILVADGDHLRSLITHDPGHAFLRFDYLRYVVEGTVDRVIYYGELGSGPARPNPQSVKNLFGERQLRRQSSLGHALGVVVWPGRRPTGEPVVAGSYRPETVTNWATLLERASEYGCAAPLQSAMRWLGTCVQGYTMDGTFPLAVVLCARRPCPLINSASDVELCPYLVEIGAPKLLHADALTPVRTAGHHQAISVPLLRRMSGDDEAGATPGWTLLGCGSLGSKLAVHLARAGHAPSTVVDKGYLNPHNAARHALAPSSGRLGSGWLGSKADAVAEAIGGLGQEASALVADVVPVLRDDTWMQKAFPAKAWAVVNATAVLPVREALASVPPATRFPRIIETSLFADANLGLLSVEGPKRNPNTGDLIAEAYELMRLDPDLRRAVFSEVDPVQRRAIGEGCGSATMAVSDARLSMLAAPMAEAIAAMQRGSLPDVAGRVLIGKMGEDGLSINWQTHTVEPTIVVSCLGTIVTSASHEVRVSARAHQAIEADVRKWPSVETGGVLVGRFSEAARAFYVTDVIPAPEDSCRSASEFVLGTRGLRPALAALSEGCSHSLYCLGTWHSHLQISGPSALDRATAATVAVARLLPSVLLIWTPNGYRALLADLDQDSGAPQP